MLPDKKLYHTLCKDLFQFDFMLVPQIDDSLLQYGSQEFSLLVDSCTALRNQLEVKSEGRL